MSSSHLETAEVTEQPPRSQKFESLPNLYRLLLPGDKPTGLYYALIRRGRKQFRRSLKTADRKLAGRRLAELKNKEGNLVATDEAAERWLALTAHEFKPRSLERRPTSIKGLSLDSPKYVNLKTTAQAESGGTVYAGNHNLTAIYLPVRYQ